MASYVLTADYWYRDEDGETATYRRGAKLDNLSEAEVKSLTRADAIAKASSDAAKRAEANPPPVVQPGSVEPDGFNQSTYGTAFANSGLAPEDASGGELTDEQFEENAALAETQAAAARAAQTAATSGDVERPAKSATADEWRNWAVKSGKVSADRAEQMNKGDLQALK